MAHGQLKENPREIGRFRPFFSPHADREARVAQRVRNGNCCVLRRRSLDPKGTFTARSLRTRRPLGRENAGTGGGPRPGASAPKGPPGSQSEGSRGRFRARRSPPEYPPVPVSNPSRHPGFPIDGGRGKGPKTADLPGIFLELTARHG